MWWLFKLSRELRVPVGRLRKKVNRLDFLRYQIFLDQEARDDFDREWKRPHREDWYLAQVAYQVYLLRWVLSNLFARTVQKPDHEFKDFLLDADRVKSASGRGGEGPKRKESMWTKPVSELTPDEAYQRKVRASQWGKAQLALSLGQEVPLN